MTNRYWYLNASKSPVTMSKTLLFKIWFHLTIRTMNWVLSRIISAIQSGRIKPTILFTPIISYQSIGTNLNPTLGLSISANILNVSDGFGNHLPGPSSAHVGPLLTIVPPGNKKYLLLILNLVLSLDFYRNL